MRIVYNFDSLKRYRNPVVAIGVFDGLHRAHRIILAAALMTARRIGGTCMVITFWPHPQKKESLYSLAHRLKIMEELGIDVCAVIRFDRYFSRLEPEEFVRDVLVEKIRARYVCVGSNFRFGRFARGSVESLKRLAGLHDFKVKVFKSIKTDNRIVSSTNIRKLIAGGKLKIAQRLLMRPVSVFGRVIRGTGLAAQMGWPTANIDPHHEVVPPSGVYAVRVILDRKKFSGICYIGRKPTFTRKNKNEPRINIEVHIFGFHRNIYKKDLETQFIRKIRGEKKFSGIPELAIQIRKDIRAVKNPR